MLRAFAEYSRSIEVILVFCFHFGFLREKQLHEKGKDDKKEPNSSMERVHVVAAAHRAVPGADRFWAWCADRGVTSKKLNLVSHNNRKILLLAGEEIRSRGSVVAAIPYCIAGVRGIPMPPPNRSSGGSSDDDAGALQERHQSSAFTNTSAILNAETIPLGMLPPALPLPDDISREWRRKEAKFKSSGELDKANKYTGLRIAMGVRERKFLWLAGLVASAAVQREQLLKQQQQQAGGSDAAAALPHSALRLYDHYAPYLDLILPSPQSLSSLPSGGADEQQHQLLFLQSQEEIDFYAKLTLLHRDAAKTLSKLIKRQTPSSSSAPVPDAELIARCFRDVIARAVSVPAGCPPEDDEDGDDDDALLLNRSMNFGARATPPPAVSPNRPRIEEDYLTRPVSSTVANERDYSSLPSLMPIVDFLGRSEQQQQQVQNSADDADDGPNVQVVSTESPEDNIRRVAIVSLRPISEGEPLTCNLHTAPVAALHSEPEHKMQRKVLSLFRFG